MKTAMQDAGPVRDEPAARASQLRLGDLLPADVLLSRGHGRIADMIVAADRAGYSHAALWSGTAVIEATGDGIAERPFVGTSDVYRYLRNGRPLDEALRMRIVQTARGYLGAGYAHGELLLLGALVAFGWRPERPLLETALELLGGPEAPQLALFFENRLASQGRMPMICSELVARAFYEVDPTHAYALRVSTARARNNTAPRSSRAASSLTARSASDVFAANDAGDAPDSAGYAQLERRCRELLASPSAVHTDSFTLGERKVLFGEVAIDAVTLRPLPAITPGDLEHSPDLVWLGQLSIA